MAPRYNGMDFFKLMRLILTRNTDRFFIFFLLRCSPPSPTEKHYSLWFLLQFSMGWLDDQMILAFVTYRFANRQIHAWKPKAIHCFSKLSLPVSCKSTIGFSCKVIVFILPVFAQNLRHARYAWLIPRYMIFSKCEIRIEYLRFAAIF